jgi:zinc protease
MTRRLVALAFLLVLLAPSQAASVKPLFAVKGVPAWLVEDHSVPVVALTASFPAGSAYDPPGRAGMAAFAAALLGEGAGSLSPGDFQAALASRGIRLEVETGRDYTTVSLLTLSSSAKEAFRLLALALAKPRFDAEAMNRVRLQLLQSFEDKRHDPAALAEQGFHSLYFGPYTYGRPVDGEPRSLQAITQPELRTFAQTHWVRGGLKLALAGDISPATAAALLRSSFATLPQKAPPLPPVPPRLGAPGLHILPMPVAQPAVFFALPAPLRNNRDTYAAMLAARILGSARLAEEVRDKHGFTGAVDLRLRPYREAGLLTGQASLRRDGVRRSVAMLRETVNRFALDGPSDRELADAKQYLKGSFPLSLTSNADIAARLAEFQQQGLPPDYLNRHARLIDAVSMADVRRVIRFWFDPARLSVVVAGSLPAANTEPADSP